MSQALDPRETTKLCQEALTFVENYKSSCVDFAFDDSLLLQHGQLHAQMQQISTTIACLRDSLDVFLRTLPTLTAPSSETKHAPGKAATLEHAVQLINAIVLLDIALRVNADITNDFRLYSFIAKRSGFKLPVAGSASENRHAREGRLTAMFLFFTYPFLQYLAFVRWKQRTEPRKSAGAGKLQDGLLMLLDHTMNMNTTTTNSTDSCGSRAGSIERRDLVRRVSATVLFILDHTYAMNVFLCPQVKLEQLKAMFRHDILIRMGQHTVSVFAFLKRCPHWCEAISEDWRESLSLPLTYSLTDIDAACSPRTTPSGEQKTSGSAPQSASNGSGSASQPSSSSWPSWSWFSTRGRGGASGAGAPQAPGPPFDEKMKPRASISASLMGGDVLRMVLTFLPFPEVCQAARVSRTFERAVRAESKAFWHQYSVAQFGFAVDDKARVKELFFTQGGRFVLFDEFETLALPSPSVRVFRPSIAATSASPSLIPASSPPAAAESPNAGGLFSFLPWKTNKPASAAAVESKETKTETKSASPSHRGSAVSTQAHASSLNGRTLFLRDLSARAWQRRFREVAGVQFVKIVLVGSERVGKTALVSAWAFDRVAPKYSPTVYDVAAKKITVDGWDCVVSLWDCAGAEDYDRLRPLSYAQANLFLVCYSAGSRKSFTDVRDKWWPEVSHHNPRTPRLLVCTQLDERETFDSLLPLPHVEAEADADDSQGEVAEDESKIDLSSAILSSLSLDPFEAGQLQALASDSVSANGASLVSAAQVAERTRRAYVHASERARSGHLPLPSFDDGVQLARDIGALGYFECSARRFINLRPSKTSKPKGPVFSTLPDAGSTESSAEEHDEHVSSISGSDGGLGSLLRISARLALLHLWDALAEEKDDRRSCVIQ